MRIDPHMAPSGISETALLHIAPCRHGTMAWLKADDTIGRCLQLYGEFAEDENRLLCALVEEGDTVVDAGANIGVMSLALSQALGAGGMVHAFEPQRTVYHVLCTNAALNDRLNIRASLAALGSTAGTVAIPTMDPALPVNFGSIAATAASGPSETVLLTTIDALGLASCALIKIDVEGMDFDVLLGAAETIARTRPCIYLEVNDETVRRNAIAWLAERNYRCQWHFSPFYSRSNFKNNPDNVFGAKGDINLLAIPLEKPIGVELPLALHPQADWRSDYTAFIAKLKSADEAS